MESSNTLLSRFDKLLLGGLGCGLVLLCVVAGWMFYILQNLPIPRSSVTQIADVLPPSITPIVITPDVPTPTFTPTLDGSLPTSIPSPIPAFFDGTPPSGKIVFACYVKQIDQICIMNADGTGREQLTDFEATAFYPSISPDGQTVYFASNKARVLRSIPWTSREARRYD